MDQSQGSTSRIPKANLHREYQKILHSLNLTAKAPEDRPVSPKGNDRLFQASIFRCKLVISFLGGDLSTLNNNCHSHILYIYILYTYMWCFSLLNKGCIFYFSWVRSSPTIHRSGYRGPGEILSIPDGFGR